MKETVTLYRKINNAGYKIYTATNMGTIFFAEIQKQYPDIFNESFIRTGGVVDFKQADIIKKPDIRYFEALKANINPEGDKQILFIDDRVENVIAARNAGLQAIHFKNARQLEKDMRRLGVCLTHQPENCIKCHTRVTVPA